MGDCKGKRTQGVGYESIRAVGAGPPTIDVSKDFEGQVAGALRGCHAAGAKIVFHSFGDACNGENYKYAGVGSEVAFSH